MRLYDGLPEPGPCDGCGASPCRCKPVHRSVPEPASATLRRLHEEATAGPWTIVQRPGVTIEAVLNGLPREVVSISGQGPSFDMRAETHEGMAANGRLVATLRNALPALADLVKAVEQEPCSKCGWTRVPCRETPLCRALAALRERLGGKP